MKVLLVHNSYEEYGGEDAVFSAEMKLLKTNGVTIVTYLKSNKSINTVGKKISTAIGSVFSVRQYFAIRRTLCEHQPDIVHVHNFFPLISPAVFIACKSKRIPVVLTLHNYRILCPTALLMHNGTITERSLVSGPWWALRQRVYKGSFIGTFILCLLIEFHRRAGTWRFAVDRYIVLSQFAKNRFKIGGLPTELLTIKPNFVECDSKQSGDRKGFLFVGRLSSEKGISTLLAAARLTKQDGHSSVEFSVGGTGPLRSEVEMAAEINYLGNLSSDQVRQHMLNAQALLLPSIWYEGFPMVFVEAFANSLPIIASRIGALAELIEDGVTGLLFDPGDANDLKKKIQWANEHPQEMLAMGTAARARYENSYTPEQNFIQLMDVYKSTIERSNEFKAKHEQ